VGGDGEFEGEGANFGAAEKGLASFVKHGGKIGGCFGGFAEGDLVIQI
jgi:hypothetical protein